jgi:heat shock protein HtpX
MAKRLFLFLATNLAFVLVLSTVLHLLGVGRYISPEGQLQFQQLAVFCFVWGMGGAFLSLQISRFMAKKALGVQLIDGRSGNQDLDWLHNKISQLAQQSNLPMPEVGVYDSPEVNAFATGPSKRRSLVAVSTGLLRTMGRSEVEGVLAHEVSHIGNGDMVTMTLLQGVLNAFVMFFARVIAFFVASAISRNERDERPSYMIQWMITMLLEVVLGIAAAMIVAWFSRQREFRADKGGAQLAGRDSMIAALRRLMSTKDLVDPQAGALASFKIAGGGKGLMLLFASHPPLEERIAALERGV